MENVSSVLRGNMRYAGLFLLLIPFMQTGVTFYISVQLVLFLIAATYARAVDYVSNIAWAPVFIALMIVPSLFYTVENQLHMIMEVGRQFVCFYVLVSIFSASGSMFEDREHIERGVLWLLLLLFFITLVQYVGLLFGQAFNIPSWLLVANQNTMIGFEKAVELMLYGGVRPSALYGEPSYLSFVCVSLVYIMYTSSKSMTKLYVVAGISLLIILMAKSLSGLLSMIVLTAVRFPPTFKYKNNVAISLILLLVILPVMLATDSVLLQRALGLVSADKEIDPSAYIRLYAPFELINDVFSSYPFGLPKEMLIDHIETKYPETFKGTDNGFLNVFINFGYSGFVILGFVIYKIYRDKLLLAYLLLASMFNGSLFTFDKIALIGFSVFMAKSLVNTNNPQKIIGNKAYI